MFAHPKRVGCPCHSVEFPQKYFLQWVIGSTVGVTRVQKAHVSEFYDDDDDDCFYYH